LAAVAVVGSAAWWLSQPSSSSGVDVAPLNRVWWPENFASVPFTLALHPSRLFDPSQTAADPVGKALTENEYSCLFEGCAEWL
jgi:hypothetical protein